jgi:DNA-directed RNA polymerase specialized sigma24 family protein
MDEMLVATAKCAIQIGDGCLRWTEIASSLPPELQRLFMLSSVGRKCFVLRILMGLTLEVTSEILNLPKDEVDEALCRALSELPGLAAIPGVVQEVDGV